MKLNCMTSGTAIVLSTTSRKHYLTFKLIVSSGRPAVALLIELCALHGHLLGVHRNNLYLRRRVERVVEHPPKIIATRNSHLRSIRAYAHRCHREWYRSHASKLGFGIEVPGDDLPVA